MQPLNIVYIHSHDTGREISPYGRPVHTPHLQRFAEQGVLFRHAFAAAPTCSPSRASLLTGQWPHRTGMLGLAHRGFALTDPSHHLANFLGENGYRTILTGFQHEGDPATNGYQQIDNPGDDFAVRDAAVDHLASLGAEQTRSSDAAPFFLSVGFTRTHRFGRGFAEPGPEEDARYNAPPPLLPDTPETREDWATFQAAVRELDQLMGDVIDAVDRVGLTESTLVICTTDHGIPFPNYKCNLTAAGTGVMLILRGPGHLADGALAGGRVHDAMVSQVDLFPTLCDLIDLPKPDWLDGVSMLPLLTGEHEAIRDRTFAEVTFHAAYEPKRSVRTKRWSYIRRYGDQDRPILPNLDGSPSKDHLLAAAWDAEPLAGEYLFDLALDPLEQVNRASDPACAEPLTEMRSMLDEYMARTDDPLRHGQIHPPRGAKINTPDQRDPTETPIDVA